MTIERAVYMQLYKVDPDQLPQEIELAKTRLQALQDQAAQLGTETLEENE